MQELFKTPLYDPTMATHLRKLREASGLSLRELARQIEEHPSNVSYWERSGNLPPANLLLPLASALGVSVEELLGMPRPKRILAPGGRMRQLFEAASKLPRSQQQKVIALLEAFVNQHSQKAA